MPDELERIPHALYATMDRGGIRGVVPPGQHRSRPRSPTPQEALHFLLSSHPLAPGLLSEARHRAVLADGSAAEAAQASRRARNAEIEYEHARRAEDPRGHRRGRFWPAAIAVGLLLAVGSAASLVLSWALPWSGRLVAAAVTVALGCAVVCAHRSSRARRGLVAGLTVAGLALCGTLAVLHVLLAASVTWLIMVEAAWLGAVVIAAVAAAVLAADRCETWSCCRARLTSEHAAAVRDHLAAQASADRAGAVAATAAWESLVVEECRLTHPAGADVEQWASSCVRIARLAATPGR